MACGASSCEACESTDRGDGYRVTEALKDAQFIVELDSGYKVPAHPCGRMHKCHIRLLLGDRVKVELSPYGLERGRIAYGAKRNAQSFASWSRSATDLGLRL